MSEPMTDETLAAIEARASAATAGPWERAGSCSIDSEVVSVAEVCREHDGCRLTTSVTFNDDVTRANADFIAAARSDVPALLAEVRRLRAIGAEAIEWLEAAVTAIEAHDTEDLDEENATAREEIKRFRAALGMPAPEARP